MQRTVPVLAIALFAACPSAFAIPLSTVGGADALVDYTSLSNSGAASEEQFIADSLGVSTDSLTYTQLSNSDGSNWLSVDEDPSLYAFDFNGARPGFYLIKTGSGVGVDGVSGTYDTFLFQNLDSQQYGVIDMDLFTRTHGQVEIGMVSHVSVPEPSTLSLLGLGLIGIGFAHRRRRAAAT